jgi:hypothetical protein
MLSASLRVASLTALMALPAHAGDWPDLPAPTQAQLTWVVPEGVLNGQAARIARAEWSASLEGAVAHYREQWGRQIVVNRVNGRTVVANRQGDVFQTVQLQEIPGSRVLATLAQTRLSSKPLKSPALISTQAWLPADSQTVQTLETQDDGIKTLTLVASNSLSIAQNQAQLERLAREGGLVKVKQTQNQTPQGASQVMWLESKQEEAVVVIAQQGLQRVSVVVTRTRKRAA